jgi:hypothetical protein
MLQFFINLQIPKWNEPGSVSNLTVDILNNYFMLHTRKLYNEYLFPNKNVFFQ